MINCISHTRIHSTLIQSIFFGQGINLILSSNSEIHSHIVNYYYYYYQNFIQNDGTIHQKKHKIGTGDRHTFPTKSEIPVLGKSLIKSD